MGQAEWGNALVKALAGAPSTFDLGHYVSELAGKEGRSGLLARAHEAVLDCVRRLDPERAAELEELDRKRHPPSNG